MLFRSDKKPKKIDIFDPLGIGESTKQLLNESTKVWTDAMTGLSNGKKSTK